MILKVKNITGTHYNADYRWELWINDEIVRAGEVRNFHRAYGRGELLTLIARQVIESGDPLTIDEQKERKP
jgi:hypothetical protein